MEIKVSELRPNNINSFDDNYLEQINSRCKILLQEAIQKNNIEGIEKNNHHIEEIEKELVRRSQTHMYFDNN